jgi:hypothetical protein
VDVIIKQSLEKKQWRRFGGVHQVVDLAGGSFLAIKLAGRARVSLMKWIWVIKYSVSIFRIMAEIPKAKLF